jgi:O-antigen ligase
MNTEYSLTTNSMSKLASVLLVLTMLLVPFGRAAEIPIALGALLALYSIVRIGPSVLFHSSSVRLILIFYAAYALPCFFSAFDSMHAEKSWTTTISSLRFGLFGIFIVIGLQSNFLKQQHVQTGIAVLIALWALDALTQACTGYSMGGYLHADRISGIFGNDNLKLGPTLAVVSPFLLLAAHRQLGRVGLATAWLLLLLAILLAGTRAGWLIFALVSLCMIWMLTRRVRLFLYGLVMTLSVALVLGYSAYHLSETFAKRAERTSAMLQGDYSDIDFALAGRLPIWKTAMNMVQAHPINGVGVRAFRYAYPNYADPNDPWVNSQNQQGASHPHQNILEILTETGLIGLTAWLVGFLFAVRVWKKASAEARSLALPSALALGVMTFPLNTHFAFYSSFWGLIFWFLIAQYAAAINTTNQNARVAS